jgi:hypothetical protein
MITQCTSFTGCWQVVFHAALSPATAEHLQDAEAATSSSMDEQLWQLAREVLQSWPGWELQHVEALAVAAAAEEEEEEGDRVEPAAAREDAVAESAPAATTAAAAIAEVAWADAFGVLGVFLRPVAVAAGSSSDDEPQDAPTAADASNGAVVELCIPGGAVQQLLSGGRSKLRVVVSGPAGQPQHQSSGSSSSSSIVLLDQEWDLQHLAAAAAAHGVGLGGDDDRAAAAEHHGYPTDVCLQLDLGSAVGSSTAAAELPRMLRVVVIAAPSSSDRTSASTAAEASTCRLVAYLPLLVLPTAAQQELQQLFDAAVAAGLTCSEAYQQLLPMVQDWATVLLWPGCCSSSSTAGQTISDAAAGQAGSTAQQQELSLHVLFDALSASFAEFKMAECLALLTQQFEKLQQQQQQQVRQEAVAEVADGSSSMLAAGCSVSEVSPAIKQHVECSEKHDKSQSKAADSSSCSPAGPSATPGAGSAALRQPHSAETAAPLSVYRVSWKTIWLGFRDAAVQREYVSYRSTELKLQDYGILLFYSIGCVAMLCKAGMLLASSNTTAAHQLRIVAIKGSMVFFNWLPFVLLWLAAKWHSGSRTSALQLRVGLLLRQRRGAVLIAACMIEHAIVHTCLWERGAWTAAMSDVAQQYHAAPVLLAIHMYAVQPLLFRAGRAPLLHMLRCYVCLWRVCIRARRLSCCAG